MSEQVNEMTAALTAAKRQIESIVREWSTSRSQEIAALNKRLEVLLTVLHEIERHWTIAVALKEDQTQARVRSIEAALEAQQAQLKLLIAASAEMTNFMQVDVKAEAAQHDFNSRMTARMEKLERSGNK